MSAIDLSPGSLFAGQFRIVRPLAKGGMGAVYVVEQVSTGRERALKLMHPMLVSDAKSIERFEREAQVGSRIESDHVVEVIAAGVEAVGPTPWMCMELLKGETLADRLERGVPRREEAIEIVEQLGHALAAAHRAGIVHRDLKPENIFLAESRQKGVPFTLKVLDFGVATLAQASELGGPKTTQGVGSPLWMAPEQTNVGKVVLATDVWAVGLIAFNLLTGHAYWRTARTPGSTITALLVEIMVEELSPASERAREISPGIALPAGFDAWFARCLVRDPGARFPDANAAFAPLLDMLSAERRTPAGGVVPMTRVSDASSAGQTQPEGFAAGPRAPVTAPSAFEETRPGPQLASGPQALVPASAPTPAPAHALAHSLAGGAAAHAPASVAAPTSTPPRRSMLPWVLLTLFGISAVCVIGVGYSIVRGTEEVVEAARHLEGEFVDPESGATVVIGPDGIHARSGEATESEQALLAEGEEADTEETEETEETEAEEAEAEETEAAEAEEAEEADAEEAEAEETEEVAEDSDTRPRVLGAGRRRARRVIEQIVGGADTATPAAHASYRTRVIDTCWRNTFEGASAPPRARYTIEVTGPSAVRISPRETPAQLSFARCVVPRTTEAGIPSGRYVFTLP